MCEKSRMPFTTSSNALPERCMVATYSRLWWFSGSCSSNCATPMMPFIGVRISWLMLARKRDLARFDASAAIFAVSSALSVFLRAVMSWMNSSSVRRLSTFISEAETSAGNSRPSACRNCISVSRQTVFSSLDLK